MESFKEFEIKAIGLTKIYGGVQYIDTSFDGYCDCLEDSNDNGKQDPGECMEIVSCSV
ncbi:hypothetical protein [Aquimarina spongiae]|uniref:Uncharacterized protein n=1 Tax=Aquimarina spongiae TaxID=570521 RepID=A0A1M6JM23_9FLAO|nr:hypothetical protein [Aquimarina spongiae]SHJ47700.1 hypothetical protein SAMN04488508_109137 [Aquimarina spongiae]